MSRGFDHPCLQDPWQRCLAKNELISSLSKSEELWSEAIDAIIGSARTLIIDWVSNLEIMSRHLLMPKWSTC